MPSKTIILFAHGARDPEWASPFQALRSMVQELVPDIRVELAFLELMSPCLGEAVDQAVSAGATEIVVAPLFLSRGAHLKNDLPVLLANLEQRHPTLALRAAPALGDTPSILNAIARWAAAL